MKLRKRIALLLATVMALSIALAGCSSKSATSTNTKQLNNKDKVYKELGGWTKPPLYQHNPFGSGGVGMPFDFVYDSLYQYVRGTDKIYARMADGMPVIDGNKMTVKIKPNVKWNDGKPFTSKDVWAYFVLNNGCEMMKYLTDIQTPDDNTVVFVWNTPAPVDHLKILLLAQESVSQIPYHIFGQYVDRAASILKTGKPAVNAIDRGPFGLDRIHNKTLDDGLNKVWQDFIKDSPPTLIGTGPFILQTVTVSDMILVRNKYYYDAKNVTFDKCEFKQVPDAAGQFAMLKTSQVNRFDGTPAKDILESMLKSNKDLIHYRNYDPASYGMFWNGRKYPLNDVNFRRAITYLFDREKIKNVGNYYATPIDGFSIMGMPLTFVKQWVPQDAIDKMTKFTHDPNKADELLKQLGWTKGSDGIYKDKNGKTFNFILGATSGWAAMDNSTEVAAEQMKAFGLPAKLMVVDGSIYYTNATNGKYDASSDWVDVTWSFNYPYFPFQNSFEGGPLGYFGMPKDQKTNWNAIKAPGPDGQTVDVGQTLHQMLYMSDDEVKQAAGKLSYIMNENCYGIDWFQNVTGTWWDMKTVKARHGWLWADQIKKYNRDMPTPSMTDQAAIEATQEMNLGQAHTQVLRNIDPN